MIDLLHFSINIKLFNYEQKVYEENNKIYYLDEINRKHEFIKFNTLNEYKDNNFNNGLILKK